MLLGQPNDGSDRPDDSSRVSHFLNLVAILDGATYMAPVSWFEPRHGRWSKLAVRLADIHDMLLFCGNIPVT
jgi:hypothetical protein